MYSKKLKAMIVWFVWQWQWSKYDHSKQVELMQTWNLSDLYHCVDLLETVAYDITESEQSIVLI